MAIKIKPHKIGFTGIVCLPLCTNIPDADLDIRHTDWMKVECPVCGIDCWETDGHRKLMQREPNLKLACTLCALKKGV